MEYIIINVDTYAHVSEKSRRVQHWAIQMFSYHRIIGNDGLKIMVEFIKDKIQFFNREYTRYTFDIKFNHSKLKGCIECFIKGKENVKIFTINYHHIRGCINQKTNMDQIPIITAEKAKMIASEKSQMLRVMEYIWQSAILGEKCLVLENLHQETIQQLENYGYEIEVRSALTENPMYMIRWI